jgi:hypothetical protein
MRRIISISVLTIGLFLAGSVARAQTNLPPGIAPLNSELTMRPCDAGLCFQDETGATQYWVRDGQVYSAEILARQKRYNAWIARNATLGLFPSDIPRSIAETGRLDFSTVAIPYYRSVLQLTLESAAFARDCAAAYVADASLARACSALVQTDAARSNEAILRRLDPGLRLRAVTLKQAASDRAAYERALRALPNSSGQSFDPDQLPLDLTRQLQAADLRLAGAIAEVHWASNAYLSRRMSIP